MTEYKRWVLLSAVVILCLIAGIWAPASISSDNAKVSASSTTAPDLIIQDITWSPEIPSIGDTVTFTIIIKNQGDSQAGASRVAYYIDDVYQASAYVNPVEPGETNSKSFTWKAQSGPHNIKGVADTNDSVNESDESNNHKAFALSVLAPDLIVDSITWLPENPSIGDKVTFTVSIKNRGNCRAWGSNVDFHIDGYSRGYKFVLGIDPGATITQTFPWMAQSGSHTVKAIADFLRQVNESDETNNERTVTYATAAPDLIIDSITWSPQDPSENTKITLSVTIKNQGIGKAEHSYVAYYIDDRYQTSKFVNQLNPGATATDTLTWTVGRNLHIFKAVADAENRIIESDETNNNQTIDLPNPDPDLIIQDITWSPASLLLAHRIKITVTVKNQGKSTAGSCDLCIYIDNAYKYYHILGSIAAGATMTRTTPWTINKASHEIRAVVDEGNYVNESNEDNNTKLKELTCSQSSPSSDLVVQDITWSPEEPSIGDIVTFTVTTKNQGTSQTNPFYVALYVDESLPALEYVNQIEPNTTTTNTFTWEAQAGLHTFRIFADTNDSISETNEDNNEKTVTLSTSAPDLVILGVTWSPEIPSAGDLVTFNVTIKNQGDEGADGSYVGYYIDSDYRGKHYVEEIDAGATATKTFVWTARSESHVIRAVADIENAVPENNEHNNEQTVALPAPDLVIDEITWSSSGSSGKIRVIVTVSIKNQGKGIAGNSRLYFCIDDNYKLHQEITETGAGAITTNTFEWTVKSGRHIIMAIADEDDSIIESNEANNEKTVSIQIPFPPPFPLPEPVAEATTLSTTDLNQPEADDNLYSEKSVVPPPQDIVPDITDEPSPAHSSWWEGFVPSWWHITALVAAGAIAILVLLRFRKRRQTTEDSSEESQESDA